MKPRSLLVLAAFALLAEPVFAGPFTAIRIGDIDGFGYGDGSGYVGASGANANADLVGVLQTLDLLPDVSQSIEGNRIGTLTGSRDDFDLRSADEANAAGGTAIEGSGFTDNGSKGSQYTDISLSTSYDNSSSASLVLINAATKTRGAGGAFPAPPSGTLTNQPGFEFDFSVAVGDITPGTDVFLNMVFGDYDVQPASVRVTNGAVHVLPLTLQSNAGGEDGLIQAAFATLPFNTVFTLNGAGTAYDGHILVDFDAPNEPYTAFDFVELSVKPISITPIPEPATLTLLGLGAAGLAAAARRRRKQ